MPQSNQIVGNIATCLVYCVVFITYVLLFKGQAQGAEQSNSAAPACAYPDQLPLQHWRRINVGQGRFNNANTDGVSIMARPNHLVFPAAIAARANDVFIADLGHRAVLHFDLDLNTLTRFAELSPGIARADLYFDDRQSLYVVDSGIDAVVRYNRLGVATRRFLNTNNPRPSAVVVSRGNADVWIADALRGHILIFNQLGGLADSIATDPDRYIKFDRIVAMTEKNELVYVVDQPVSTVHVFSEHGVYYGSLSDLELTLPSAIAVDDFSRVYVIDHKDDSLKIFLEGELQGIYSKERINRQGPISDIWIDGQMFYATYLQSGYVDMFLVLTPCP